jgi:hypothetical protein
MLEVAIHQHQATVVVSSLKSCSKTHVSLKHLELAFNFLYGSVWDTVYEHFGCCKFAASGCRNNCVVKRSITSLTILEHYEAEGSDLSSLVSA